MQPTFPLAVGVRGKSVVDWPNDLIHALDISDPRVEFGIDEEDPLHHLPVCLAPIGQHLILVGWIQVERLSGGADLGEHIQFNHTWSR